MPMRKSTFLKVTLSCMKDRLFSALSAKGVIEAPLQDQFWGDYFGSFVDKFGIHWMINYNTCDTPAIILICSSLSMRLIQTYSKKVLSKATLLS